MSPTAVAGTTPPPSGPPEPIPSTLPVGVATGADAAARVIAADPRFAGVMPLLPDVFGQSAWYDVTETPDGFLVTITIGWGDCQAGCIARHTWAVTVSRDGALGAASEGGDGLPGDLTPPIGSGDVTLDLSLVAGPICPVETNPPQPGCEPRPVANATVSVRGADGVELVQLVTGPDGRIVATLPNGVYVFAPLPVPGLMGTPDAIAASLVGPGSLSLTLAYDTGIR